MIPVTNVPCGNYTVATRVYESSILADLPDGGVARIRHKKLEVIFTYKTTGDRVTVTLTKKGNFYWNGDLRMSEEETRAEFKRLVGKTGDGHLLFKVCQFRLV